MLRIARREREARIFDGAGNGDGSARHEIVFAA
jgi:hypothetical protein